DRGSVGQFLNQLHQGTAGSAGNQTAAGGNLSAPTKPPDPLVVTAPFVKLLVVIPPLGGLIPMFRVFPAVPGVMTGIAVAATLAGLLDGVGLTTAGAAAAVALPLVTLVCLRVLDHADDRTVARVDLGAAVAPSATPASVPGSTNV